MATYEEYVTACREWKDAVVVKRRGPPGAAIVRAVNLSPCDDLELVVDLEFIGDIDHPIPKDDSIRRLGRFKANLSEIEKVPTLEVLARVDILGL